MPSSSSGLIHTEILFPALEETPLLKSFTLDPKFYTEPLEMVVEHLTARANLVPSLQSLCISEPHYSNLESMLADLKEKRPDIELDLAM